jgi:cytochrome c2
MARILLAALMATWTAAAHAQTAGSPESLERRGQALVEPCGVCHAIGPTGMSKHADAPRFRTLALRGLLADFEKALNEKRRVRGPIDRHEFTFEANDAAAIIAYLKTMQTTQTR